ncbi:hypothetical protein [Pseudocitrobacter sp. RIT415]|uniref:hypothetical protein n=1 Tax=Pseudocitrobacter sp. RIT415 TaxID=2202163 RepID=UPI001F2CD006|nr:hypothetical protein [Pseudocitrobacter sp. RIT 415]
MMSDSTSSSDYLYLVLVPVAEVFRSEFPKGTAPFNAIRTYSKCRVKFTSKRLEREWQEFYKKHDLKNDPELEY